MKRFQRFGLKAVSTILAMAIVLSVTNIHALAAENDTNENTSMGAEVIIEETQNAAEEIATGEAATEGITDTATTGDGSDATSESSNNDAANGETAGTANANGETSNTESNTENANTENNTENANTENANGESANEESSANADSEGKEDTENSNSENTENANTENSNPNTENNNTENSETSENTNTENENTNTENNNSENSENNNSENSDSENSENSDKEDSNKEDSDKEDSEEDEDKEITLEATDGVSYRILVTYTKEAQIPEGASLKVVEILPGDASYEAFVEETALAMGTSAEELTYVRVFDIEILVDGVKVEPAAPVKVKIEYITPEVVSADQEIQMIHFAEDGTQVMQPDTNRTDDGSFDEVSFETDSFSVYTIASSGTTTDLDGKTYALIIDGRSAALLAESHNTAGTKLQAASVRIDTARGKVSSTEDILIWTFTKVSGNNYYISTVKDGTVYYLNVKGTDNNGTMGNNRHVRISTTPQEIYVEVGTGSREGKIRLRSNNTRNYQAINLYSGSVSQGFGPWNDGNDNEWFTLYDLVEMFPVYTGDKISVQDIQADTNGNAPEWVIIYKTLFNETTGRFEDYVIDGNGNLVRAYDKGAQVTLRAEVSPIFEVRFCTNANGSLNGYYIIQNIETGLCLSAQEDGTLVAPFESNTTSGVTLNGKRDGQYNSTIEKWDSNAWAWIGYNIITNEEGAMVLQSGTGASSMELSFARYTASETEELHPVETVDNSRITIHMFNYPSRSYVTNITGHNEYNSGRLPSQHVKPVLVDGQIVFTNNNSSAGLFSTASQYYVGDANHLFLASVYNATGYYEYNAFHNYAYYNNGTFTVYEEIATPKNDNAIWYKRGNFLPFNNIDVRRKSTNLNTYDSTGNLLDVEDPTDEGTLYLIQNPDYYFGMTVEATFMQPKNGTEYGSPVVYEFNGDDDLWVYIDNVLILDIGGIHDAWEGTINFATGVISGRGAGGAGTIKDCFKNAGIFPDGTPWDESLVDFYFKGNTFVDYGSHTLKMFYMEHGEGASNLEMRFNLPVIEKGRFTVEKELTGTSQQQYSNVYFAFQAFEVLEDGEVPLSQAVYEGTQNPITFYDNVEINGGIYSNVFYLKPGEAATFPEMPDETRYYVQELGIGSDYYDTIIVNDVIIDGIDVNPTNGIYPCAISTIANRARVTYANHCSEKNLNELRITKAIAEGSVANGDTFEFRVLVENMSGILVPYSTGAYYVQNENGDYFRYQNGVLTNNGKTPVVASVSGNNGTIEGIPAGYTIVIKDLLAGTHFYVEEIRVRENGASSKVTLEESSWNLVSKEISGANAADEDMTGESWNHSTIKADGKIVLDTDVNIVFTNERAMEEVTLQKIVDGNLGDINKKFSITISCDKDFLLWNGVSFETIQQGEEVTIELRHSEQKTLKVISGSTLTVKEEAYEGYTQTIQMNNGETTDAIEGKSFSILDDATITVTNTKNGNVDTGITVDSTPYQMIVLMAGFCAILFFAALLKGRREEA